MTKNLTPLLIFLLTMSALHAQNDPNTFVLLNIEMLSRAQVGEKLQEMNKAQPKLVALNVQYSADRGTSDDPLEKAFEEIETDILGYNIKDRRMGSHPKFMQHAADSGMTRLVADVRLWPMYFVPYQTKFGTVQEHLSMRVASYLVEELPEYAVDGIKAISYTPKLNYTVINLSEFDLKKHGDLIKDQVVFVGFMGPGDEDKQFTPLGEVKGVAEGEKDTYGLEILVYMVKTILDDSTKKMN